PDLVPLTPPPRSHTVYLSQIDPRPQRLRGIDNAAAVLRAIRAMPDVQAATPVVSGPAFAQRGNAVRAVAIIGIEPGSYVRIIPVDTDMVAGQFTVGAQKILIGSRLATDLGLAVGDTLRLTGPSGQAQAFRIAGIFTMGVRDVDERQVYLGLQQAQTLLGLPGSVTEIDMTVYDLFAAKDIASRIARTFGVKAESWMTTNSQLLNALQSQSLSTNIIRLSVALSVALGIASVLAVSVVQRTREIGILRAMGATRLRMMSVFLIQGGLLGLAGSTAGALLGVAAVYVFNTSGPRLFPVTVSPWLVPQAMLIATLAGVIAAYTPARRASRLDPVEAIRTV
ncbi:MAG: ABC transporter permease, partial [Thiomonas sp.]